MIDPGHFSVNPTYYGVILGGAILGLGFALGGYCPGTCVVALGRGRKDAAAFLLGALLGAFAYMQVFGLIQDTALFNKFAGGAVSIAETNVAKFGSLTGNLPALLVAGPIAIVFMLIAFFLPDGKPR